MKSSFLSVVMFFALNSILCDIIVTPAFLWLILAWYVYPSHFLKWDLLGYNLRKVKYFSIRHILKTHFLVYVWCILTDALSHVATIIMSPINLPQFHCALPIPAPGNYWSVCLFFKFYFLEQFHLAPATTCLVLHPNQHSSLEWNMCYNIWTYTDTS